MGTTENKSYANIWHITSARSSNVHEGDWEGLEYSLPKYTQCESEKQNIYK